MLKIENLNKAFGKRSVLQDLNLHLIPGEIYGLLGPNGAGKTTTINLICNLLHSDRGSIHLNGLPVSDATKSLIGITPQENLLYRSLTCRENLAFFAQIYGLSRATQQRRIHECLAAVNLEHRANCTVETLSGGMQRRLSMAIALIHEPYLVILDEPTTGLDIEARYEIWDLIRQLKGQGITVLLTTHLLEEAERLCQRVGILKQGRLLAEGTLETLRELIPAKEIVYVETANEEAAIALGRRYGFTPRRYGRDLAFWVPEHLELREILHRFDGISLDMISRQPVRLEHIYIEVTQGQPAVESAVLEAVMPL